MATKLPSCKLHRALVSGSDSDSASWSWVLFHFFFFNSDEQSHLNASAVHLWLRLVVCGVSSVGLSLLPFVSS